MYSAYVLRSRATHRLYSGATSDLPARLVQHNSDLVISTKHRGPWDLIHSEEFPTLAEARRRERHFKTGKGRDELHRILAENCP